MNIKYVKLSNGEEFVCDVLEDSEDGFHFENPDMLVNVPDESGTAVPTLMAWNQFSGDRSFKVPKANIMFSNDAVKNLEEAYRRKYSGIEIATTMPKPPEK